MSDELKTNHRGNEVTAQPSKSGAVTNPAANSPTTPPRSREGMVVLDAIHQIQANQANDLAVRWNCKAGKCGSCSAEINGMPKLMCMTRLNTLPLDQPITVQPMKTFPLDQGPGHGRLLEFRSQEKDQEIQTAQARRPGRYLAHGSVRCRSRAGVPQVHRMFPMPGRLPRPARSSHALPSSSARVSWSTPPR